MCGFSGEMGLADTAPRDDVVRRMTSLLERRGPDAEGFISRGNLSLGHRRLRIIDLTDRGHQPMVDDALGLTLAFNGCIYNYRELRGELESLGYGFMSGSDTEVILKAWHAWGSPAVRRLQGMFAFALHEHASGRVHLVRDRMGIKPLYLASNGGDRIHFASSLPAMLQVSELDRAIDPVALHHYLSFHAVVPAPHTIVRGVRKVPPATIVSIDANGDTSEETYWRLHWQRDPSDDGRSAGEWAEQVGECLERAVARRMVADVPVGVLLSGGIDSSLIVGLLARSGQSGLNTFSIGFESVDDEAGDEFAYSDLVADHFGTAHHRLYMNESQVLEALPGAVAAMSEPMTSHDNVAFYLLAEQVKRHVKVVQSGQGADEVFAGYHWYPKLAQKPGGDARDYARVFFDRGHEDILGLVPDMKIAHDVSQDFIRDRFLHCGADALVDRALHVDTTVMLPNDPVMRVDNMTMAAGLEARVPFLDHELVELAARIPAEHKLADGGKGVLRRFARGVIPDAVIDRPKGYFPVPALKYLRGRYLETVADALRSRAARERGLFDSGRISDLIDNPDAHITPLGGSSLWQVGLLEMWLQAHDI